VLRRTSQLSILGMFLLGPWTGTWIAKGTLSSSLWLDILPLTDPLIALQSFVAGHVPELAALTGALIVAASGMP
jgi:ferredoxin-type protein NapH